MLLFTVGINDHAFVADDDDNDDGGLRASAACKSVFVLPRIDIMLFVCVFFCN